MARRARRAPRILGLIFLIIGITAQLVAGGIAVKTRSWLTSSVETSGTVNDHVSRRSRKGRSYAERVAFKDAKGVDHEFVSSISTSDPFPIGATIPVRYDPADPAVAAVNTPFRNWFVTGLVGVIGLVFTGIGMSIRRQG